MTRRQVWVVIGVGAVVGATGCGYSADREQYFRTTNAKGQRIRTVAVDVFSSREFRRGLEVSLTEAVVKRINAETPFRIAKKETADTLLTGTLKEVRQSTVARDFRTARPRETTATVVIDFEWKDLRTGEILLKRPNYVQTVDYIRPVGEDFHHGSLRAIDRMAERMVEEMGRDEW